MTSSLSVVVCTHNRPRDLERCLEGLAELEDPVQLIVVDSASVPPYRELVRRHSESVDGVVYLREDRPGLSRARNAGTAAAKGEIVAFLDDDASPRRDWARRIAAPFDRDPTIGCVGGTCSPLFKGVERPCWLSDRLLQFAGITRFGVDAREATSSAEWPFGANIAFRREALAQAGPFSETLGRTGASLLSGDEGEVIESLRRHGWKVWLEPGAIVEHTVRRERCQGAYYWRRLWWQGVTRARSREASLGLGLRLGAAAAIRLVTYAFTRDRVYLYRTAETAAFWRSWREWSGRAERAR